MQAQRACARSEDDKRKIDGFITENYSFKKLNKKVSRAMTTSCMYNSAPGDFDPPTAELEAEGTRQNRRHLGKHTIQNWRRRAQNSRDELTHERDMVTGMLADDDCVLPCAYEQSALSMAALQDVGADPAAYMDTLRHNEEGAALCMAALRPAESQSAGKCCVVS